MLHSKQMSKRMGLAFLLGLLAVFVVACSDDGISKSKVDGVSDEVYEQLLEQYFYLTTFTDMLIDNTESDEKSDMNWVKEHELYDEAIEYAEAQDDDIYPPSVFPNALLYEHHENPEDFSKEEVNYIEKMLDYMEASNRMELESYTKLKEELKDELKINEKDNMFP